MSLINLSESNKKSKFAEGVKKLIKGIEKSTKVDVSGDMNKSDESDAISLIKFLVEDSSTPSVINIPKGVTRIDRYAFGYDDKYSTPNSDELRKGRLLAVSIPNTVTEIGDYAFFYCTNLDNITLPSSITQIGEAAFMYCRAIKYIKIENTEAVVTLGGQSAFEETSSDLKIYVPDNLVDSYKLNGTNWNSISNKIFPISQFEEE